jgi:hypothetical protein
MVPNLYTASMNASIDYRGIKDAGQFRAVRLWRDEDGQAWVIDAERKDGTLSTQDWGFVELTDALLAIPLYVAVLVYGVAVTIRPGKTQSGQAQAPAIWVVDIPIAGGGAEISEWPSQQRAESFLRTWVSQR